MAYAKTTVIQVDHNALTGGFLRDLSTSTQNPREFLLAAARYFDALASGLHAANVAVHLNGALAVAASGTLTFSGGSGTVGGVIGGTTVTVTWGTSDTASAAALATAINANATVNKLVSASSLAGVVTVKSLLRAKVANEVTLTATGTGVTASGSGKLTGGAGGDVAASSYSRS